MRRTIGLSALAASALAMLAGAAQAQSIPDMSGLTPIAPPAEPTAMVRVYSAPNGQTRWSGEGPGVIGTSLCIASTTGRYRLVVTSMSGGGLSGSGNIPFDVIFIDGSGASQTRRFDRGAMTASFEGVSPSQSNCDRGANARLEISAPETAMRAQIAGAYSDRLVFKAEPL